MSEKEKSAQNGGINMEVAEQIEPWKQGHFERAIFNVRILTWVII
jgi:hypothetical protein